MAVDLKALGLDKLTRDEKREVVAALVAEVEAETAPASPLTDAQRTELRRRLADADANPDDVVPWEEALAATRRRLGQ